MKAQNFLLQTICCVLVFSTTCNAQYNYPPTKTVDSSDTYFGVTYKDPYRWLENIETPEVETWFKQQATYTDSIYFKYFEWKRFAYCRMAKIE